MATPIEVIPVETRKVACDGGRGGLGHPKIYMQIPADADHVDCAYCSRRYVLKEGAVAAGGH
jgi:uncharacterized Zn-finger protein